MSIYVIGDLHLSFSVEKPMDIYGGQWLNHTERVRENWIKKIRPQDTVIIPGDISWGLRLSEAMEDLRWIDELPGKKLMFKGNHDLWWNSIGKLNKLFDSITFVQNTFAEADGYLICGSRGWSCPGETGFTAKDQKIYLRELGRLRLSLEAAKKEIERRRTLPQDQAGEIRGILGVLHYPPTNERLENSGFTDIFAEYGTEKVVYGHLHGKEAYKNGLQGWRKGIEYILTSCDKLKCDPYLLYMTD